MTHATGDGECGYCRYKHGKKHLYGLFLDDLPHFFTNSVENPHDFSVFLVQFFMVTTPLLRGGEHFHTNSPPLGRRGWGG